jgi:NTE family protein
MNARLPASGETGLALALGAGGARGLGHIVVLETLDAMGIRPVALSGASIGAIIGAAYAAGMSGKAIRRHILTMMRDRTGTLSRLLQCRVGRISDLFQRAGGLGNPVLIDGERLLDLFWPKDIPDLFEDLTLHFRAVATDYHLRHVTVFETGPLVSAVAASMAIPGLIKPVRIGQGVYVDAGATDPVPIDCLDDQGKPILAVDVIGGAQADQTRIPQPLEAILGASQIMQTAIARARIAGRSDDPARNRLLVLTPPTDAFGALDFFKAKEILAAADQMRESWMREIEAFLKHA